MKRMQTWLAISGIIAGILLGLLAWKFMIALETPDAGNKSIAVLPFTSLTSSDGDQSFADGVHDDILTQLAKIGDLQVISRTSVVQFKGTVKSVKEIAAQLGVANILEGSVRRAGNRIRIVAQLINAATDEHLWAETYDRDYADIFAIQSDVAQKIARALKATLSPVEKEYIEERYTENLAAWDFYTQGKILSTQIRSDVDSAIILWDKAVQLDEDFLLPYLQLVRFHAAAYFGGLGRDPSEERLDKALSAMEKASALNPDHPEVHLAKGYYHYYGFRDYKNALDEFDIAQEKQPNNSDLLTAISLVKRRQGKWMEAQDAMKRACEKDPMSYSKIATAYENACLMRRWDELDRYYKWLVSLMPEGPEKYLKEAEYQLWTKGDIQGAKLALERVSPQIDQNNKILIWIKFYIALAERDYEKALAVIEEYKEDYYIYSGFCNTQLNRVDQARADFNSARVIYEKGIEHNPKHPYYHMWIGIALSGLNQCDEAVREGQLAIELLPVEKDVYYSTRQLYFMVILLTHCGRNNEALDLLEQLLATPSYLNLMILQVEPFLDKLRDLPRYKAIIARGATTF